MVKFWQHLICYTLLFSVVLSLNEARPQNALDDNNQDVDALENDVDELRSAYYDLPNQSLYPNIPVDRLKMLMAQYRPNSYVRSWGGNMGDLYRVPESKRQVRYRQCYFNPISCFRK